MTDYQEGVNFCLINQTGALLLQQRDEHCRHYPLQWAIPGGAKDGGESFVHTVVREVKEEYDLSISANDCLELMNRPWSDNPGKVFIVRAPSDQQPKLQEGKAFMWVQLSELKNKQLGFRHNELVEYIQEFVQSHREWLRLIT